MKIVTLLFACMAWLEFTIISAFVNGFRRPSFDDLIIERFGTDPSHVIQNGDTITVQKVIGGNPVPRDIVEGVFERVDPRNFPDEHDADNLRHGNAFVIINSRNCFFVRMTGGDGYVDTQRNEGEAIYRCEIKRNNNIFAKSVLIKPAGFFVPIGHPRVLFLNHAGVTFTGELIHPNSNVQSIQWFE